MCFIRLPIERIMNLWISIVFLIWKFTSNYVDAYRLYNFGQHSGPRVQRPILKPQPLPSCFLNKKWFDCPIMSRDMILNLLTNARGRDAHYNSESMLHRLFEAAYNHNEQGLSRNLAPVISYPRPRMQEPRLSWVPQRRTLNEDKEYTYPKTATSSPVLNNNIALWQVTPIPEVELFSEMNLTTTTESAIIDSVKKHQLSRSGNTNLTINTISDITTTAKTIPFLKPEIISSMPLKTATPIFYNVEIGVSTKTDEETIKKYVTINEFSEFSKKDYPNMTISSTNNVNRVATNRNNTISSPFTQYRMTSSKGTNNSISNLNPEESEVERRKDLLDSYSVSLDELERKFYSITFNKLKSISPEGRRENGISFVQSGLFLSLQLMAFSTETDENTTAEIDQCLGLNITKSDKINIIKDVLSDMPKSNFDLKWRWSSRLVLGAEQNVSEDFRSGAASALQLFLGKFHGNETDKILAQTLNHMVEEDSGGAIRDTFDPEELSDGVRAVALTTLYMRGRWRSAPTVLNGSRPFRDADGSPPRTVRMIRLNDYVRYANFEDWKFQAIEIFYATRGLSLLMLVPDGRSLRGLADRLETLSIADISKRMISMRIAVTMPLYTLRMTLLLPSKFKAVPRS
ncbi:uncharacterized protein LOC135081777 isoform X2 [Ostrinia nubilalis]|uniref:uncharacterized protein LOC135081777 isoform X2 n=2 Tax=Ostrinia TaxID=29056 RepID=UPI0030826633